MSLRFRVIPKVFAALGPVARRGVVMLGLLTPVLAAALPSQLVAQAPPQVVLDSIVVEGAVLQSPEQVLAQAAGLRTGSPTTLVTLQQAQKALWATGRYDDIQVFVRGEEGQPVVLILRVDERPVVDRFSIEGLETIGRSAIADSLKFSSGDPYSPERALRIETTIREQLAEKGVPFVRVEEEISPVSGREKTIDLVMRVEEGDRVSIAEVVFEGNELFSDEDLAGAIETREEGFWWFRRGLYSEETLAEDLIQRLPDFYASRGYLDFRILGDTVIVDPETGKARVEISVDEGQQYRVANFDVQVSDGSPAFPVEELKELYNVRRRGLLSSLGIGGAEEGQLPVFDRPAFEAAAQAVQTEYFNEGYIFTSVSPSWQRHPPDSLGGPATVSIRWRITEGPQARIRRVDIIGNDHTYDWVARDVLTLLPGDVYQHDLLFRSYQALSGLGFFEVPLEEPDIIPVDSVNVDVIFKVKEKSTGSLNFGVTLGGGTGLAGFIGYTEPNLFGQGKSGSFRWDFGRFANNFAVSYADPALFRSRVSGSVSLFNSRDRFFSFTSGRRRRVGAEFRVGFPVPGSRWSRLFLGYSLSRTELTLRDNADDTSIFGLPPGTKSAVTLTLRRNTLAPQPFPIQGSFQSFEIEQSGGMLGGNGEFTKYVGEARWYTPVGSFGGAPGDFAPSTRLTMGLTVRGGALFGDAGPFPFDRFWMGGVQFGESLRGYDETSITPFGFFPEGSGSIRDADRFGDAFFKVSGELALRISGNLSVSAFYDAGNVWREPRDVNPSRLFRGTGVGVEVVTPFGPIGIDYAYGFDKLFPSWQFHFRMGPGF